MQKTGNVSFDTIVNYKAAVAQKNHINVKLDTMIPYDMKLEGRRFIQSVGKSV